MPMGFTSRAGLAAVLAALLAGCNAGGGAGGAGAALEASVPDPAAAAQASFESGAKADVCPPVTLREGTAILRRDAFVASIAETTRDCRVVGGRLVMQVGVSGRLVPTGTGAASGARLPIRVAVTRGGSVLYSQLGQEAVTVSAGSASTFAYVDRNVVLDGPSGRGVTVFAGFDDGPNPAGGRGGAAPSQ